ncbi:MAG: TIGR04282 family arsenosugar biosynthesis glycosyltransferase [Burkholderiales bacterium]|nr:TIGR04282 family arsenosugar biosynthesis glycosyltransferase [Burkholderiales bacterium]
MTPVLQVFARAPVAGACKTRLIPALGAAGAASLQENLVRRTLATAAQWRGATAGATVQLWCAPASTHPFFADCARAFGVALRDQADGGLGARMWLALVDALRDGRTPVLVGTDCPWLDAAAIGALFAALARAECAAIPALDGGYVAIGLARAVPELFAGVDWGSARVMAQTRARARRARAVLHAATPLPDVDVPGDLARLRADPALAPLVPAAMTA